MARKGAPSGRCTVCAHAERVRIDWLLASGQSVRAVAAQFGLGYDACWRHGRHHVSDNYRRSVKLSAEVSEEQLRKICADEGAGAFDKARALFAIVFSQLKLAEEAGDRRDVATLTREAVSITRLLAQLSHELMPSGPSVVINNVAVSGDRAGDFTRAMIELGAEYPAARPKIRAILHGLFGSEPEQPKLLNITPVAEGRWAAPVVAAEG